jgi:hypothetical protein
MKIIKGRKFQGKTPFSSVTYEIEVDPIELGFGLIKNITEFKQAIGRVYNELDRAIVKEAVKDGVLSEKDGIQMIKSREKIGLELDKKTKLLEG